MLLKVCIGLMQLVQLWCSRDPAWRPHSPQCPSDSVFAAHSCSSAPANSASLLPGK